MKVIDDFKSLENHISKARALYDKINKLFTMRALSNNSIMLMTYSIKKVVILMVLLYTRAK